MQITLSFDTNSADLRQELLEIKKLLDTISEPYEKIAVSRSMLVNKMRIAKKLDVKNRLPMMFNARGWHIQVSKNPESLYENIYELLEDFIACYELAD